MHFQTDDTQIKGREIPQVYKRKNLFKIYIKIASLTNFYASCVHMLVQKFTDKRIYLSKRKVNSVPAVCSSVAQSCKPKTFKSRQTAQRKSPKQTLI